MGCVSKKEWGRVFGWALGVMLVTCLPYLIVWFPTPLGHEFPWVLFNSDDHGVYFAWMRQAADGKLLFRNLFTNEPQRGIYLHAYFLALGQLARLPGLDVPLAYHLGRLIFGALTLVLVYRLGAFFTEDRFERACIFWTTALSAGLGWLFWFDQEIQRGPVDVWQTEALTFPSLYVNGLFCVSLALMLGFVISLLLAETRGRSWAVGAGLCGLVLGNIHSYDVIHLALLWVGYLGAKWVVYRRFPAHEFQLAVIAGLLTLPSVAHMAWFYKTEPTFKARADTATWSPHPIKYLLGYGFLVPLAVWGWRLLRSKICLPAAAPVRTSSDVNPTSAERSAAMRTDREPPIYVGEGGYPRSGWWGEVTGAPARPSETDQPPLAANHGHFLVPLVWSITGIAAAYLPFAFQRKMVMGYHLPLALLAGLAVAELSRRAAARVPALRSPTVAAALCVAVLSLSNVRFLIRDVVVGQENNVTSTGVHPVYWPENDLNAFRWMHENTGPNTLLFAYPLNGVMAPSYSDRTIYAGHWGETPDFERKVKYEAGPFFDGRWTSAQRLEFLRRQGITHVLLGRLERLLAESRRGTPLASEPFLRPVFQQGDTTLFEVVSP